MILGRTVFGLPLGLLLALFGLLSPWPSTLVGAAPTDGTFDYLARLVCSCRVRALTLSRSFQFLPLHPSTFARYPTYIRTRRTRCTSTRATYRLILKQRTYRQRSCPHTFSSCSSKRGKRQIKSEYCFGSMYVRRSSWSFLGELKCNDVREVQDALHSMGS